ncbi:molybdenum cofactor biosynthesis protein B [Serratia microhaemolytica]|uniref:molybdenum cofactor biosynthesis protein B n=1 Tax=Serratia microhaemolytica TaxID=2675110 RepID=UPI000FDD8DBC|nr:molybdenum cofactor biosynthesis protein B [Serratia microhaemolytica]
MSQPSSTFIPANVAILTISDRRSAEEDSSGDYLQQAVLEAGHQVIARTLLKDNLYQIRAQVAVWIADEQVQVILINGGTGYTQADNTPEAISPLFDRQVEGFGELFRMLSFEEIGTACIQSRALAGMANQTVIFAMPGSPRACCTAWEKIIKQQLDARHRPCNFLPHLKK